MPGRSSSPVAVLAGPVSGILLTTLQEEAQWAVATGQVKGGNDRFPDFLTRLDSAPLARAVPHAVGLIGVEPE